MYDRVRTSILIILLKWESVLGEYPTIKWGILRMVQITELWENKTISIIYTYVNTYVYGQCDNG